MAVNIEAPQMGESITEATVATWVKKEGDFVKEDDLVAELETEKINLEVTAPKAGKITTLKVQEGDTVSPGDVMAELDDAADAAAGESKDETGDAESEQKTDDAAADAPAAKSSSATVNLDDYAPAVRRLISENDLDPQDIKGTGKGGKLTKQDVEKHLAEDSGEQKMKKAEESSAPGGAARSAPQSKPSGERTEERVKMTALRKTIARRLKESQNNAAMLTTFNEVDLHKVMELRKQYKDAFKEKYGANLGFMSFFTKAVIYALKEVPALNAEIDGDEIVYKHYYDIGIAVSAPRGLVVPVIRDADSLSFAGIEQAILDAATKAKENKLLPDDLEGGTFTITNGGVFGSMLSTPIINTPQVGILGMHGIKERPVVVDGEVKVRPMMYLAMSYDHRLVDGRESVTFLVKVKEALEDPARLILEI